MSKIHLIAGLGNPGQEYEWTRHNLGFLVVRQLAEQLNFKFGLSSLTNGLTAEGVYNGSELCLLMPLTYMNHSGVAVQQVVAKREIAPQDVLIVCDDFNLEFEQIRLRGKGSDGGHNGLSSVIERLGTDRFARLRMGIGQPSDKKDTVDYVLEEFKKKEKERLSRFIGETVECCKIWVTDGIEAAMDRYNRKV